MGLAYSDKGYTALKLANHKEAEDWFRRRLELVRITNNPVQIASRMLDVALAILGQGRYSESKALLEEAQTVAEGWKRGDLSAELLFGLARIEREIGDADLAQKMETDARQLWNEMGFKRDPFVYILDKPEPYEE